MKQTKTIIKLMENHLNEIKSDQLRLEFANTIDRIKLHKDCRNYVLYELRHMFEDMGDMVEDHWHNKEVQSLSNYAKEINGVQNLLK